jgi:hypothetical protein
MVDLLIMLPLKDHFGGGIVWLFPVCKEAPLNLNLILSL